MMKCSSLCLDNIKRTEVDLHDKIGHFCVLMCPRRCTAPPCLGAAAQLWPGCVQKETKVHSSVKSYIFDPIFDQSMFGIRLVYDLEVQIFQ